MSDRESRSDERRKQIEEAAQAERSARDNTFADADYLYGVEVGFEVGAEWADKNPAEQPDYDEHDFIGRNPFDANPATESFHDEGARERDALEAAREYVARHEGIRYHDGEEPGVRMGMDMFLAGRQTCKHGGMVSSAEAERLKAEVERLKAELESLRKSKNRGIFLNGQAVDRQVAEAVQAERKRNEMEIKHLMEMVKVMGEMLSSADLMTPKSYALPATESSKTTEALVQAAVAQERERERINSATLIINEVISRSYGNGGRIVGDLEQALALLNPPTKDTPDE